MLFGIDLPIDQYALLRQNATKKGFKSVELYIKSLLDKDTAGLHINPEGSPKNNTLEIKI